MTKAARTALINIGVNRQGSTLPPGTSAEVTHELTRLGLLGRGSGLTRRGTIKREQIMGELLDAAFREV